MQITLSAEQTKILKALAHQGQFDSVEATLDAVLVLLAENLDNAELDQDPDYLAWLETTGLKIDAGLQDITAGKTMALDDVLTNLQNKVQAARTNAV